RRRCRRGPASVHDDAWRRETAFVGGNVVHARLLPQRRGNANRIPLTDPPENKRRVIVLVWGGAPRPPKPSEARQPFLNTRTSCSSDIGGWNKLDNAACRNANPDFAKRRCANPR